MIQLSILVPSTNARWDNFNIEIQKQLFGQYDKLSALDKSMVEILMLVDTKTMPLGEKRNWMVDIANGKYVVHVDSDDILAEDYIKTLLDATKSDADVISFLSEVTINAGNPKICDYSIKHKKDYNTPNKYYRIPNHITAIKREHCISCSFPSIPYGEDAIFAKLVLKKLKTEHKINKVLYYYKYDDNVTEAQFHLLPTDVKKRRDEKPIVDVIILSKAYSPDLQEMTQKTIDTAIAGANHLPINVIVIEQIGGIRYENAQTIFHDADFNYNAFMNLGARSGEAEYIVFANNDLLFHNAWLHNLLATEYDFVSPHEPNDSRQGMITENTIGDINGTHFSGWCFMMKRTLWEQIGGLDEEFGFWFADDSVIEQCKSVGVLPMLVKNSVVEHLVSTTLNRLDLMTQENITWGYTELFNRKYNKRKFIDNPNYIERLEEEIAIAISTRGRKAELDLCVSQWNKHYPKAMVIIVEDNGIEPMGIAKTKNICIEELKNSGREHLFLADNDIYPTDNIGLFKYAESRHKHLCFTFSHRANGISINADVFLIKEEDGHSIFNSPCGCLMYIHRDIACSDVGFDENYGIWGCEHKDYSMQLYNNGLTEYKFVDISNSHNHFYSMDYHSSINSSVEESVRVSEISRNIEYFNKKWNV